jgi:hypothetical protein
MTEAEWLTCNDPDELLGHVGAGASERKARLLACACCRRLGDAVPESFWETLGVAERYADRQANRSALVPDLKAVLRSDMAVQAAARAAYADADLTILRQSMRHAAWSAAGRERAKLFDTFYSAAPPLPFQWLIDKLDKPLEVEYAAQADLVRDVFGNRFRPTTFSWRTSDAVGLARLIYDDRVFDRLPILADALTDAGCDDEDILAHCRSAGPHVRGCWVVDLVLGKE